MDLGHTVYNSLPDTGMAKIATSAVALLAMHVSGGDDANPGAL